MGRKSRRKRAGDSDAVVQPASAPAGVIPEPKARSTRLTGPKLWILRALLVVGAPLLCLALVEGGLSLAGRGFQSDFFVPVEGRAAYTFNDHFGWRFFPRTQSRGRNPFYLAADKEPGTYRIFVLGGSAANGDTPDEAYSFSRILQAMLQMRFPGAKLEVINVAMVAINSHVVLPIARACAEHDPDLFVVYMGNNEVVGPYGSGTVFGSYSPNLSLIRAGIWLRGTRVGQVLYDLISDSDGGSTGGWAGMATFMQHQVTIDDPRLEGVYGHFRRNLVDLCETAADAGAEVIVSTVVTNLRDAPPFASQHRSDLTEAEQARWTQVYQQGIAAAEADDLGQAIERFRAALAIDDRYAELFFRLGLSLEARGKADEARKAFVRARDLDTLRFRCDSRLDEIIREIGGGPHAHLVDAQAAAAQSEQTVNGTPGRALLYEHVHLTFEGNYVVAQALYEQIVERMPEILRAHAAADLTPPTPEACARRLALTGPDRLRMAQSMHKLMSAPPFTQQLGHDAEMARQRAELVTLERRLGTPAALDAARNLYVEAMLQAPRDPVLRVNRGRLDLMAQDYASAEKQARWLLDLIPGTPAWIHALARAVEGRGRLDQAVRLYREVLRKRPFSSVRAHNDLAMALIAQRKLDEAEAELNALIRLRPGDYEGHLNLANVYALQNHLNKAIERYRRASAVRPDLPTPYQGVANIYRRLGRLEEAMDALGNAARVSPDEQLHFELANLMVRTHRIEDALIHYRKALAIKPDWPIGQATLAWHLATAYDSRLRNGPEALRLAQAAQARAGIADLGVLGALAAAYAETGAFDLAVTTAQAARQQALAMKSPKLVAKVDADLALYRQGQPRRQAPGR